MSKTFEVQTSRLDIGPGDGAWVHAVHAAMDDQGGTFEPTDGASRQRLLDAVRQAGYLHARLDYLAAEGVGLPLIRVWQS